MSARRVRRAVRPTEKERFGPPETQNRPLPQRHTREQNWAVDRNKCFHGEIGTHSCICFPDNGVDTTSVPNFTPPFFPKEAPSLPLKRCCHSLAALTSVVVDDRKSRNEFVAAADLAMMCTMMRARLLRSSFALPRLIFFISLLIARHATAQHARDIIPTTLRGKKEKGEKEVIMSSPPSLAAPPPYHLGEDGGT